MNNQRAEPNTSIVATLAYFDIFNYPLTALEIWRILLTPPQTNHAEKNISFEEILENLQKLVADGHAAEKNGWYFLPGRESSIKLRHERYALAERKYHRAIFIARLFSNFPFIKMIAVANTLAISHSTEQGDVDFFILAANGRLWLARFLTTGFLKIFGLRPGERVKTDPICLSFFLSDKNLSLASLAAFNPPEEDVHFALWTATLVPLYAEKGIDDKFFAANNWARKRVAFAFGVSLPSRRRTQPFAPLLKKFFEWLLAGRVGEMLERLVYRWQTNHLPEKIRAAANKDTNVVISESVIKLHDNDRRALYRQKFLERYRAFFPS